MRNKRKAAIVTGISIIIMAIVAGMVMGAIFTPIFEMSNEEFVIQASQLRVGLGYGIVGWLIILICDLLASWGLWVYYRGKHSTKATVMAVLRVVYSLILLMAITRLFQAYAFLQTPLQADAAFENILHFWEIWQFGLIIFGFHLLLLAPLVWESRRILNIISVLLALAGVGYVLSNSAGFYIDGYEEIRASVEAPFIIPMIFGELGLAIWLWAKGGR